MISPQEHVEEVKTETEEYYERILRNSRQKNTALKLKSIDSLEKDSQAPVGCRSPYCAAPCRVPFPGGAQ